MRETVSSFVSNTCQEQAAVPSVLFLTAYSGSLPSYMIDSSPYIFQQLMKQNAGISNIEITDENIKAFEATAKKYGIDFD